MENKLIILRGVSGSGKTTLAKHLSQLPHTIAIAADDYWYKLGGGKYAFDTSKLGDAHSWCRGSVDRLMQQGFDIVLHNTNTSEKELKPYLEMAEAYGYTITSLVVENRHGGNSVHNVPNGVLDGQERRLANSIKLRG